MTVDGLPHAVLARLRGACREVSEEPDDLGAAAGDWWPYGAALGGCAAVARPASTAEVAAVLVICREIGLPVTPAGGRSGVCGGAVPLHGGLALDLRGLSGIMSVDGASLLVDVGAGTFGHLLEHELRAQHGLTLGHWPQSMDISTVGGWLACRSAGQFSTRYGKIEDMVVGVEAVLADGTVIDTNRGPRAAMGPDLTATFVGSEGTLGVITRARLRAWPAPTCEARAAFAFTTFGDGLDACRRILRRHATPAVLRLYDRAESAAGFGVDGRCLLLVLDEGDPVMVDATMTVVDQECAVASHRLDEALVSLWMERRNDVSRWSALTASGVVGDTIEIAAPWSRLAGIHQRVVEALRAVEHTELAYAHQSHAYRDGACLYFTFAGHPPPEQAERFYVAAWDAAADAILAGGGTLSHHHGIGLNKARFLRRALGEPAFTTLVALRTALDPTGILNPGKLGLPDPFGTVRWPSEPADTSEPPTAPCRDDHE